MPLEEIEIVSSDPAEEDHAPVRVEEDYALVYADYKKCATLYEGALSQVQLNQDVQ